MPTSHISKINRFFDKINKKMIFFLFNFIGYFWPLFFSLISEVTCWCMFREKRMYTSFYLWNQRKLCVWLWNLIIWSQSSFQYERFHKIDIAHDQDILTFIPVYALVCDLNINKLRITHNNPRTTSEPPRNNPRITPE